MYRLDRDCKIFGNYKIVLSYFMTILMIISYEISTLYIFGTPHRCTKAIYVATLLLLLTSPPSSALDAIEPPTRPQAKSSQEILNGKPFYEYILAA